MCLGVESKSTYRECVRYHSTLLRLTRFKDYLNCKLACFEVIIIFQVLFDYLPIHFSYRAPWKPQIALFFTQKQFKPQTSDMHTYDFIYHNLFCLTVLCFCLHKCTKKTKMWASRHGERITLHLKKKIDNNRETDC